MSKNCSSGNDFPNKTKKCSHLESGICSVKAVNEPCEALCWFLSLGCPSPGGRKFHLFEIMDGKDERQSNTSALEAAINESLFIKLDPGKSKSLWILIIILFSLFRYSFPVPLKNQLPGSNFRNDCSISKWSIVRYGYHRENFPTLNRHLMIFDKIVHSGNYQHNEDARYFSDDENS